MSRRVTTPQNLVKLTNVAVVRLQRGGRRFEVACYPSKVVDYRNGKENNLDEVLQVRTVFSNVSKGIVASAKDLSRVFGEEDPVLAILDHGELQVSDKERGAALKALFRDVASIVADKTVDERTGRPPPVASIETYMRDELHFGVTAKASAKQQALDVIKKLEDLPGFGVRRAPMRLRTSVDLTEFGGRRSGDAVLLEPKFYKDALAKAKEAGATIDVVQHAARGDDLTEAAPATLAAATTTMKPAVKVVDPAKPRKLGCQNCRANFADAAEHRAHFKSEWHRTNLKRVADGQPPLSEAAFGQVGLLQ